MTIEACAGLVERGDHDRFAAVMAAPIADRARLFPLYAFNLEVARAPWVTKEPLIAEMRLQWWRDVVAEDRPRAHEVAGPLHALIRQANLPLAVLDALIAARLWDVYSEPFADAAAFDAYLDATSGGLMWLAARALGAEADMEPAARGLGWAMGLAGLLRAVPVLIERGRRPLIDGRDQALVDLAQRGLARLARARGAGVPKGAALAAWQTEALLRQIVVDPGVVSEGQMGLSEFRRRGLLAWQAMTGRF
ncbi:MAG: squalene/phytoene synthase family protein [Paracoccaceae bacterium]